MSEPLKIPIHAVVDVDVVAGVIEILHENSELARRMVEILHENGMCSLCGAGHAQDGWMDSKAAAAYAGCSRNALHKAMAAREIHFEQDGPGGKAWFKRSAIDFWRRGERPPVELRRAA